MYVSSSVLRRLAADRHADRMLGAKRARLLAQARIASTTSSRRRGAMPEVERLRSRLADLLVSLAARVGPAHRDASGSEHPASCTPPAT